MRLTIKKEFPVFLMIVGVLLIQFAEPVRLTSLISMGTWLIFLASIISVVLVFLSYKLIDSFFSKTLIMIVLVFVSLVFSSSFSYKSIVSALCFLELPFFLCFINKKQTKDICNLIYWTYIVLSLYYIVLSFSPLSHYHISSYSQESMVLNELTLGYSNPNETAIYLLVCVIALFSCFFTVKKVAWKCFLMVDILCISYLMFLTQSRAGLIIEIFIFVCFLVQKQFKGITYALLMISFLVPFLFFAVTYFFPEFINEVQLLGFGVENGRVNIFQRVYENMTVLKFLFGDFSFQFENLHNGFVAIWGTVGIAAAVIFYNMLYSKFKYIMVNHLKNNGNIVAWIGLLGLVLWTAVEASLICSGTIFAASFVSIFILSVNQGGTTDEDSSN